MTKFEAGFCGAVTVSLDDEGTGDPVPSPGLALELGCAAGTEFPSRVPA